MSLNKKRLLTGRFFRYRLPFEVSAKATGKIIRQEVH